MSQRLFIVVASLLCCLVLLTPARSQPGTGRHPGAKTDPEKRLDALEKQLAAIAKEIDELRKELKLKKSATGENPDFHIFRLKHAVAADVVQTLQTIFGDTHKAVRLVADPVTNSVLVLGTPEDTIKLQSIIDKLDVAADTAPPRRDTRICTLKSAEAADMAALLNKLFLHEQHKSISVAADARSNSVVVIAFPADIVEIEALLSRMDVVTEQRIAEKPPAKP